MVLQFVLDDLGLMITALPIRQSGIGGHQNLKLLLEWFG